MRSGPQFCHISIFPSRLVAKTVMAGKMIFNARRIKFFRGPQMTRRPDFEQ